jgi:hypothetical protein
VTHIATQTPAHENSDKSGGVGPISVFHGAKVWNKRKGVGTENVIEELCTEPK